MKKHLLVAALLALAACKSSPSPAPPPPVPPGPCTAKLTPRIFDGNPIPSSTYPFAGALAFYTASSEGLCTASLVCPNVILTAAHCFYDQSATTPNAPLSAYRFTLSASVPFTGTSADTQSLPSDATSLKTLAVHPGWTGASNLQSVDNDMAMALLAAPFPGVPLAPLASALPAAGAQASILGYGESEATNGSQQGSFGAGTKRDGTALYAGTLPADATGPADPHIILTQRIAGNNQDTCSGDSGSPLIVAGQDLGTLSGGDSAGCGVYGTGEQGISFYSSAVANAEWIQAQMKAFGCDPAPPVCGG